MTVTATELGRLASSEDEKDTRAFYDEMFLRFIRKRLSPEEQVTLDQAIAEWNANGNELFNFDFSPWQKAGKQQ